MNRSMRRWSRCATTRSFRVLFSMESSPTPAASASRSSWVVWARWRRSWSSHDVDGRWSALFLVLSLGGALVLSSHIKGVANRPATSDAVAGHTFPSGSTTTGLVLFLAFMIVTRNRTDNRTTRRLVATGASSLIAVSGTSTLLFHCPTEVLSGYALGGLWLSLLLVGFGDRLRDESRRHTTGTRRR
jgi:hypothetical protein